MSRLKMGLAILLALLMLCSGITAGIRQLQMPISVRLNRAADLCRTGQFDQAAATAAQAKKEWTDRWAVTAAVADHCPMEQIDSLFAVLEGCPPGSRTYPLLCRNLAALIRAIPEAHQLIWRNLLAGLPRLPGK